MQFATRTAFALLAAPALSLASGDVTATEKVVQMLTSMSVKAKAEKKAEEVAFSEFSTWCTDQTASLTNAVAKEREQIEVLTGTIGKLSSSVKVLGKEIGELQSEAARFTSELKAAKEQRDKDHEMFRAEHEDYDESVDALDRAISILTKKDYDRTAPLQMSEAQQLPAAAQSMVSAFLGFMGDGGADPLDYVAPEARAYESKSGALVEMLKKLKGEFAQKKGECEKEEINSRHAYEMLAQDLQRSSEITNEDISEKSQKQSAKKQEVASLKKDLGATQTVRTEDEKTLSDTKVECREKKASFEEKQQLREEEIQALEQAISVLSSHELQAAAAKHLTLSQAVRATVLAQTLRGTNAGATEDIRSTVRRYLAREGSRLHSNSLNLLAQRIAADPFIKVKKLIEDLITRLLEESKADADHEGFCDKELGQSKITRTKLSETVEGLNANIETGKARITELTQEIARLTKELAELEVSTKEVSEMRAAEKDRNAETIKDAADALKALQSAMAILKEFYAKASVATALFQFEQIPATEWGTTDEVKMGSEEWKASANPAFKGKVDRGHKQGMQTFGATYQGQQEEAGGVLAMLEVIQSDFATLKADTEASEALSAKTHREFLAEASRDKAVKSRKVEQSNEDKLSAEGKLRDDTADLKFAQDKTLATERYYQNLKPQCLDQGMTFEQRTKARADEIQSLKEALRILEGEQIP